MSALKCIDCIIIITLASSGTRTFDSRGGFGFIWRHGTPGRFRLRGPTWRHDFQVLRKWTALFLVGQMAGAWRMLWYYLKIYICVFGRTCCCWHETRFVLLGAFARKENFSSNLLSWDNNFVGSFEKKWRRRRLWGDIFAAAIGGKKSR